MREQKFDIQELSNITQAISSYYQMASYFPTIDNEQLGTLTPFVTADGKYKNDIYRGAIMQNWNNIDIHIVDQMWGSTSCGWGGMGGSAMTTKFNVVIENKRNNAFFVFWDGKLAYAAEMSEKVDYSRLPYITDCEQVLKVIYKRNTKTNYNGL